MRKETSRSAQKSRLETSSFFFSLGWNKRWTPLALLAATSSKKARWFRSPRKNRFEMFWTSITTDILYRIRKGPFGFCKTPKTRHRRNQGDGGGDDCRL